MARPFWAKLTGWMTFFACTGCRTWAVEPAGGGPAVPAADYYVATNGNDNWSGTLPDPVADGTDGPFATLTRARDEVRRRRAGGELTGQGITVLVRGGRYQINESFVLAEQDGGRAEAPVVYRTCHGETARLSGGPSIPAEAFGSVTDPAVLARLDEGVRDRVLQADLARFGVADLPRSPVSYQGAPDIPELFFNNERMRVSRWPNEGWATVGRIVEAGSCPRNGDKTRKSPVFEYTGDRPARWDPEAGVWLHGYYCFDWYEETIRIRAIDTETKQITLDAPAFYSLRQGNPSPRRYQALNVFEELTDAGEYYIDRAARRIYFLPPGSMQGAHIAISALDGPVVRLDHASHLVFQGFTVEASRGNGIDVIGGEGNRILACEVRNTRQLGISIEGGKRHRVEACDVHATGTGGISLDGGDRRTLTPGEHEAVNNHVWRFSCHKQTYANAFTVRGVGNRVAHSLIHDAPHQAVSVSGNDCVFEYNIVHDVCVETDDCGAFYKGRNPSCRGNIVRYNFWYNIGGPMGHGNAAVYFDDGDGGESVIGNVFFRCGDPGKGSFGTVFSHGGHDLVADNNIFIECKRSLGSAPWNYSRWKQMIQGSLWRERLLEAVDVTKPPYTTHYPALVGFMEPEADDVRVNRATRNVIVMGAEVKSGNWQVPDDTNWVTGDDPGFVDAANGDFRLRPDSAVFENVPGFEPIPFEKMGLYADALRPSLPTEPWTHAPPKQLPPLPARKKTAPPPKPKTGPPPVFNVPLVKVPITIDGAIEPTEWHGANSAGAMPLAQDVGGHEATRTSQAWLACDDEALYIAIDNAIHPATSLDGNAWGGDDAIEVSLRPVREKGQPPIAVVRGFGNGFLSLGMAPNGVEDPKSMEPGPISFKANRPAPDRWTAEFRIPFQVFDYVPGRDGRILFNITVRKAKDNLWLMWEGTRAHSYHVERAGIIDLARGE